MCHDHAMFTLLSTVLVGNLLPLLLKLSYWLPLSNWLSLALLFPHPLQISFALDCKDASRRRGLGKAESADHHKTHTEATALHRQARDGGGGGGGGACMYGGIFSKPTAESKSAIAGVELEMTTL